MDTYSSATWGNFLGESPNWYKTLIISFLIINPILFFYVSPYVAGWALIIEFIFTLAMALKCYPLQPGGLLAMEAVIIGMTTPEHVLHEIVANIEVILLLVFMVAGIYFMKSLLLFCFTKIVTKIRNKKIISLLFCFLGAFLSAFLDALTVIAVVISVGIGFYVVYHKVVSEKGYTEEHDHKNDNSLSLATKKELDVFRGFLRNLLMHAGVGTALGGVMTMVGEPQNLIIAQVAGWEFAEFAIRMSPVTIFTLIIGLITCYVLEVTGKFGYGIQLPENVFQILKEFDTYESKHRSKKDIMKLWFQGGIAIWLIAALALHLAAVGLIGLTIIILATSFCGITKEHDIGHAFEEALPFTALLAVFFAVVAVIIDQELFTPVIQWALSFEGDIQLLVFFLANGFLSMVSDNVFVGTVYIKELSKALSIGSITRDQFDLLAVAVNTGTNLPSVATPNGQAAFLFLLTSAIAPLIRLSYGRMVIMAIPYTIVLTIVGLISVYYYLPDTTQMLYDLGLIHHHVAEATDAVSSSSHH